VSAAWARLRAGLILLAVIQAGQGAWQYFAPRSFYGTIPTVAADPPFNDHLLRDVGGLNLALAVVLAAAAWRLDRTLTRVALIAYLIYSGSHLAFHATDQAQLAAGQRTFLLTSLAVLPVLAAALLLLTTRPSGAREAREPTRRRPGAAADPGPVHHFTVWRQARDHDGGNRR
jgi:hypothetical protein